VLAAAPKAKEIARFSLFPARIDVRLRESALASGVPLVIIDCPMLYERPGLYQREDGHEWEDNALRFGVLSKVAAMLGSGEAPGGWRADVVHCNDWQASLAPVYLAQSPAPARAHRRHHPQPRVPGRLPDGRSRPLAIPPRRSGLDGLEYYGQLSFLKGGLMFADAITTVSPTYAREIQTRPSGSGSTASCATAATPSRRAQRHRHGLVESRDRPAHLEELSRPRPSRQAGKQARAQGAAAPAGGDDVPLLGLVSRLTHQKGIDVLAQAGHAIAALPAQLVVLGTGDREMVGALQAMRSRHPDDFSVTIGFDEDFAHQIEAGATSSSCPRASSRAA
jgi:starch synthase